MEIYKVVCRMDNNFYHIYVRSYNMEDTIVLAQNNKDYKRDSEIVFIEKQDQVFINYLLKDVAIRPQTIFVFNLIHNKLLQNTFELKELYKTLLPLLKQKYPDNNNHDSTIRRSLQLLRDHDLIIFLENGKYKRLW